jgi:hypothetical protein
VTPSAQVVIPTGADPVTLAAAGGGDPVRCGLHYGELTAGRSTGRLDLRPTARDALARSDDVAADGLLVGFGVPSGWCPPDAWVALLQDLAVDDEVARRGQLGFQGRVGVGEPTGADLPVSDMGVPLAEELLHRMAP